MVLKSTEALNAQGKKSATPSLELKERWNDDTFDVSHAEISSFLGMAQPHQVFETYLRVEETVQTERSSTGIARGCHVAEVTLGMTILLRIEQSAQALVVTFEKSQWGCSAISSSVFQICQSRCIPSRKIKLLERRAFVCTVASQVSSLRD